MTPVLPADQDSDENRLLKSWGFKFNAQGKLLFKAGDVPVKEYKPWNPEFSGFKASELQTNQNKIIDPLVISSKNKVDE